MSRALLGLLLVARVAVVAAVDCSVPRDVGFPCDEAPQKQMFYFVPGPGICQPFRYNGCGGNGNRFNTSRECRDVCSKMRGGAKSPADDSAANLAVQFKEACQATFVTDFVNATKCKSTSDCSKQYECRGGFCCPTPEYVCHLNYDTGKFAGEGGADDYKDRYYFNPSFNTCMRFSYYGSLGNANNFVNFNQCMKMCGSQRKPN